ACRLIDIADLVWLSGSVRLLLGLLPHVDGHGDLLLSTVACRAFRETFRSPQRPRGRARRRGLLSRAPACRSLWGARDRAHGPLGSGGKRPRTCPRAEEVNWPLTLRVPGGGWTQAFPAPGAARPARDPNVRGSRPRPGASRQ